MVNLCIKLRERVIDSALSKMMSLIHDEIYEDTFHFLMINAGEKHTDAIINFTDVVSKGFHFDDIVYYFQYHNKDFQDLEIDSNPNDNAIYFSWS
jgi:hypothetical protein